MGTVKFISKLYVWRLKNIGHRQFILILSFFIGLISGLAAVLLKNIVHYTGEFILNIYDFEHLNYFHAVLPIIGILFTVFFVKYVIKDNIGHGISKILYAISKQKSQIKPHNNYSSVIASIFTVGFGGSVGLEAPVVLTGSSLGSSLASLFRLNYKNTTLLIGCGAAGAIAGIFKAPIAAIVFALEVLMLDLTVWSIIPLLISSVTGASVSYFLLGKDVVFSFSTIDPFVLNNIPYYIILGVICGFMSLYFTKGTIFIENTIKKIKNDWKRFILGAVLLGLLILVFPPFFGEGYDSLKSILGGDAHEMSNGSIFQEMSDKLPYFLIFLLLIIIFKVFATALTSSSGGVGGIFAPTLFTGGVLGYLYASVVNILNNNRLPERNFALVAMGGMMAGVMHAPLTGIFLIAEITGGYALFIPLMIVATISYLTIRIFEKNSLYSIHLAQRGELITHHKDKAAFILMKKDNLIEKDFKIIHPDNSLGDLVQVIKKSRRNVFPVVDDEGNMVGILTLNDIRDIMFQPELYETTRIGNIMYYPSTYVNYEDSLEKIAEKIELSGRFNVPVLDKGKYLGFVSRAKIFSAYRKLLKEFSEH